MLVISKRTLAVFCLSIIQKPIVITLNKGTKYTTCVLYIHSLFLEKNLIKLVAFVIFFCKSGTSHPTILTPHLSSQGRKKAIIKSRAKISSNDKYLFFFSIRFSIIQFHRLKYSHVLYNKK